MATPNNIFSANKTKIKIDNSTLAQEGQNYKDSIDKQTGMSPDRKKRAKQIVDEYSQKIEEIEKNTKNKIIPVQFDLGNESQIKAAANSILSSNKSIDILVNNAGITRDSLFMRMKEEQWDEVFNVNMKGVFHCTKNVVRSMIKK